MSTPGTFHPPHTFLIYPAIDLRAGKVVRLLQGDPDHQTIYHDQPAEIARQWARSGAGWIHVVNLDGAFGEEGEQNLQALRGIITAANEHGVQIQFGGGIRSFEDANRLLSDGVNRIVIGTMAIRKPRLVTRLINQFDDDRVAVALDAKAGEVYTQGWTERTGSDLIAVASSLKAQGLKWLIYTDILRDGMKTGLDLSKTQAVQEQTGLMVVASGGVSSISDVLAARDHRLAGVIVGKALYENHIDPQDLFSLQEN